MSVLKLKNSKFSYIRKGKVGKPKMLMLHPFLSSYEYYLQTMDYLKEDFDMIALDIPGFGRSRLLRDEEYSLGNIADSIITFCNKLHFKPFHIVGSSLGGMISIIITANYSKFVKKAVFHATPVRENCINQSYLSNILEITSKKREIIHGIQKNIKKVDPEIARFFISTIMQEYEDIEKRTDALYIGFKHIDFECAAEILRGIKNINLKLHLKNIKKHVLVIIGDKDITVFFKCKREMHELL
ncbi:alpha/beta fold hydrolase, partial [Patescibacteria group bacterium]